MGNTLLILALLFSVFLIGCTSFMSAPAPEIESRDFSNQTIAEHAESAPAGAPAMKEFLFSTSKALGEGAAMDQGAFATAVPSASVAPEAGDGDSSLQLAQRRVISTASISIEVKEVQIASVEVRRIAENLGGFVEHLSSSGGPSSQQANITIRVPQDRFFTAAERLMALETRTETPILPKPSFS